MKFIWTGTFKLKPLIVGQEDHFTKKKLLFLKKYTCKINQHVINMFSVLTTNGKKENCNAVKLVFNCYSAHKWKLSCVHCRGSTGLESPHGEIFFVKIACVRQVVLQADGPQRQAWLYCVKTVQKHTHSIVNVMQGARKFRWINVILNNGVEYFVGEGVMEFSLRCHCDTITTCKEIVGFSFCQKCIH